MQLTVTTLKGLEAVLAKELESLGAQNISILNRAVGCEGDLEFVYKANYCCRTAIHVLKPVVEFDIKDQAAFYDAAYDVAWEKMFAVDCKTTIDSFVFESVFTHSRFLSQRLKDAICDRLRKKFNQRPIIENIYPEIRLVVHLNRNHCIISLDSSGQSLHKRGYRAVMHQAPINEVLAAGLIKLAAWDEKTTFYDPMCGSGTLLMEAAMLAANIPAQYYRKGFAFEYWNDFDPMLWKKIKEACDADIHDPECEIYGSDISQLNLNLAMTNIQKAKLHHDITLKKADFLESEPPSENGLMIFNPPYGERLKIEDMIDFYKEIGNTMKRRYAGWDAWMISSDLEALKFVGLRPSRKIALSNGKLECKFEKFSLYEGEKYSSTEE